MQPLKDREKGRHIPESSGVNSRSHVKSKHNTEGWHWAWRALRWEKTDIENKEGIWAQRTSQPNMNARAVHKQSLCQSVTANTSTIISYPIYLCYRKSWTALQCNISEQNVSKTLVCFMQITIAISHHSADRKIHELWILCVFTGIGWHLGQ